MQAKQLLFFAFFLITPLLLSAQEKHKITIAIEGYDQPILSLANNLLDKQYIIDTARVNEAGEFVFTSDTAALPKGIYLAVLAPDNQYFQLLVGNDPDQEFRLETDVENLAEVRVESSRENALFYEYTRFLDEQQERSKAPRSVLADSTSTVAQRTAAQQELEALNEVVNARQADILRKSPDAFVAAIINTNAPNPPPEYADIAAEDERNARKLRWLQTHYFDKINLRDDRLLRTPFLFDRIEYFVDKLFIPHPDTIATAIDFVLDQMDPKAEMFKYYVSHFINKAANSKIVGMDALYVHMVDNYYANGRAYWTTAASVDKMKTDVEKIRPLLIGKKAPDMRMKKRDGTPVRLYDIEAEYTILYFWQFACGSCKKSTPVMKDFYAKWKDRGVSIFSVCTKQNEIDKCWEYIDEREIGDWLHATDRYLRFYRDYDIRSTPTIFVLDKNKKIVSKQIGAQQLDELLTALEQQKAG